MKIRFHREESAVLGQPERQSVAALRGDFGNPGSEELGGSTAVFLSDMLCSLSIHRQNAHRYPDVRCCAASRTGAFAAPYPSYDPRRCTTSKKTLPMVSV